MKKKAESGLEARRPNSGGRMKIAFAASEAAPFIKTGGLADVAGALPKALSDEGCEVIVVMPLYGGVRRENLSETGISFHVNLGNYSFFASVFKGMQDAKTPVYFISQDDFYSRPNPYGDQSGDYADNDKRFIFFNLAFLELLRRLSFKPDVIHVNDWHLGLVPALLKNLPKSDFLFGVRSVLSIHNLAYQGLFPADSMRLTGLPETLFTADGVEMYGKLAFLKSGIMFADRITAVSPAYAREILTTELGFGLETILKKRKKDLTGILNGIDTDEWNPASDALIPFNYSAKALDGKAKCRDELLKKTGLGKRRAFPVIGIVSRMIEQKGFDIIVKAAEELMKLDCSLAILGTGQGIYEDFALQLAAKYPDRVWAEIGFSNPTAHLIEAGSDMFLMPSRFEPCGLNQMYSMAYGTPPVVRSTGGLKDSVADWDAASGKGTGFVFKKPDAGSLVEAIKRGIKTYKNSKEWNKLVQNGMRKDFSWHSSAKLYMELYKKMLP
jgi:starch synthase